MVINEVQDNVQHAGLCSARLTGVEFHGPEYVKADEIIAGKVQSFCNNVPRKSGRGSDKQAARY